MPPKNYSKDKFPQIPITSFMMKRQPEKHNIKSLQQEKKRMQDKKSKEELNKSLTQRLSQLSAQSSNKEEINGVIQQNKHINVLFYLNKLKSQPFGQTIDFIHKHWWKDYKKLERDHSFIQWIFPNSFQSRFNKYSKPLSLQQAQIFKKDAQILKRYKLSYKMMLQFYGMKMKNDNTGQITRSRNPDYRTRFYQTLLTSFHNHMRITRILTSLSQLGFSRYAYQLCKFLKQEIYSEQGGLKNLSKYNVYSDWKCFERYEESEANTNIFTRIKCYKTINQLQHQQKSLQKQIKLQNCSKQNEKQLMKQNVQKQSIQNIQT